MKFRTGFVSNSSSSSFIIGVAEVADVAKLKQYAQENGIKLEDNYDIKLTTLKELKGQERKGWETEQLRDDKIIVDSFDYDEVSISSKDMKDDTHIVIYTFFGNEGDGYFRDEDEDDDWSELNYDRVYENDFFDSSEDKILSMFGDPESSGLNKNNCEFDIGAARNG